MHAYDQNRSTRIRSKTYSRSRERMEIYLIIALSFTIVYWWNYIREIILTVQGVEGINGGVGFKPIVYTIAASVVAFIAMPRIAFDILRMPRRDYIKNISTAIIKKHLKNTS